MAAQKLRGQKTLDTAILSVEARAKKFTGARSGKFITQTRATTSSRLHRGPQFCSYYPATSLHAAKATCTARLRVQQSCAAEGREKKLMQFLHTRIHVVMMLPFYFI